MSSPVDAHHHFWRTADQEQPWRDPAHHVLARDYLPGDLAPALAASGIVRTVLVQSVDSAEENDRLHAFAITASNVAGVVGYLPLAEPAGAHAELDRADTTGWRGVRCLVGRDPLDWLAGAEAISLFAELARRRLVWDVVVLTSIQARAVSALAEAVPDLRIVVDHLARPELDTGDYEAWTNRIGVLAHSDRIAMKVSVGLDVLASWGTWDPEQLRRYVEAAVEYFGPDRLLLASNWPVIELGATHRRAIADLSALVADVTSPAGLAAVRGGSAERWYGLQPATGKRPMEGRA